MGLKESAFTEKEKAFLRELTALSREHGVIITGCGCCGSPSLEHMDCSNPLSGYGEGRSSEIEWLEPGNHYWDDLRYTIVR